MLFCILIHFIFWYHMLTIQRFFLLLALLFTMVPLVFCSYYDQGKNCTAEAIAVCDKLCAKNKESLCTVERNRSECTLALGLGKSSPCSDDENNICKSLQNTPYGCTDRSIKCECQTTTFRTKTCGIYPSFQYNYCEKQYVYRTETPPR